MDQNSTVYLKDYTPPPFFVDEVVLHFELAPDATIVTSTVSYRRNGAAQADAALRLDGHDMELLSVHLDGELLDGSAYRLSDQALLIENLPEAFELKVATKINPEANTSLEGLYRSSGNFCTQCEAQGFRKITYYQDRPDVMAPFRVRIEGDRVDNPVMLSNGNPVSEGDLDDGRHWVEWVDPFPKPAYLFALVAGDLQKVEDSFRTCSGRDITLQIFTEAHHIDHCGHAMESLKRAMAWDEKRFGLEYDLDLFMIVAVDDFNMGAMENKGLNIFNSRLVFASPETATDDDYIAIEAVIGHEYFHNWTGNRVTCRDWFQLSLKEGLTVFRDQEFTADLHSRAVKRIEDVRMLRSHQFVEDASPMAHPIRPASYMEINNFYTLTVYEKGAEVVRLYQSLLGVDGFRRGMDLYFDRFDGQAVTTEDFLAAMTDANEMDLSQMQNWYDQAGTPQLKVSMDYDAGTQSCRLHCEQYTPDTPESNNKQPLLIPLSLGLILPDGTAAPLQLQGEEKAAGTSRTLLVKQAKQSFEFVGLTEKPLPSLLRGFSAPVILDYPYSVEDDAFLMAFDDDPFNRWAAAQRLAMSVLLGALKDEASDAAESLTTAFSKLMNDHSLDAALRAEALMLPSEADIAEAYTPSDPGKIHLVRESLLRLIAQSLRSDFESLYASLTTVDGDSDQQMQDRKLKNVCLFYLSKLEDQQVITVITNQFTDAENMTDQYAAMMAINDIESPVRKQLLDAFYDQWQHDTHVMDKWFSAQAVSSRTGVLDEVKALMNHPMFTLSNPNKVRALIGAFAMRNPAAFHAEDGSGYAFLADQVLALNKMNPQVASRMVRPLMHWKRLEAGRSALMRAQLQRLADTGELSPDVYEIVMKSL